MSQSMNEEQITAYVFGELSAEDTAEFESQLQNNQELAAAVASTRAAIDALKTEFKETAVDLGEQRRAHVQSLVEQPSQPPSQRDPWQSGVKVFAALAIAAGLLLVLRPDLIFNDATPTGGDQVAVNPAVDSDAAATEVSQSEPLNPSQSLSAVIPDGDSTEQSSGESSEQSSDTSETITLAASPDPVTPIAEAPRVSEPPPVAKPQPVTSKRVAGGAGDPISLSTNLGNKGAAPSPSVAGLGPASNLSISGSVDAPMATDELRKQPVAMNESKLMEDSSLANRRRKAKPGENMAVLSKNPVPAVSARGGIAKRFELDAFGNPIETRDYGTGPGNGGDQHDPISDNPFYRVTDEPLSTFSIDVDTAAYAKVRMYLMQQNAMPRPDAVRIEELVNYFNYKYEAPSSDDEHPFTAAMQIAECPWNENHRLARIGLKGRAIEKERPASNLVFLLDVSGSMRRSNKLPLVVEGMKMLVDQLTENDSVAIVVYAGAAGMVLDSTTGDRKNTIIEALDRLRAGGSTNGGEGIQLAYQIARDHFIPGGTNRVILCSDGDFNVGVTGTDELVRIAADNAKGNVFLSVLGFGMGNHNDAMMEQISNKGNGNYAFIDTRNEARKVLVEQIGSTLVTIAKDVKIQVEFNPKEVASYRLIGYENRILAAQDFNDDKKDAGEIGAGHTVTALYELVPADGDSDVQIPEVDDLRYQKKSKLTKEASAGEWLTLKLRYKQPEGTESTLMQMPVTDEGKKFGEADQDFRFAASVAAFGMLLRDSPHKGNATFAAVKEIATEAATGDTTGYRAEFLDMVDRAIEISGE